ncbi:cytochrome C [Pandoraea terrae]|uniref:Cytochrome C n=1 Tax=Pandoraea terrae TaxID=1537710 RepID=A0A5E4VD62_9BURK|nr:c-type cytochrome [Pandoraea terrae]VVE09494.1 cytochrome C [Pandoraea terrae]
MNERKIQDPRVEEVNATFEPWEPSRPIPLLLLAIFVALIVWGALSYFGDLAPKQPTAPTISSDARQATPQPEAAVDPNAPVIVTTGTPQVWSCASCHGAQGQGAGVTPRIAGLEEPYIAKQLRDFAHGFRSNESMQYVARSLSEEDIDRVAKYYAALPTGNATPWVSSSAVERGRHLNENGDWKRNVPACATCHGQSGEGVVGTFPRLAGQQPDYIASQLIAWRDGRRKNSPQSLMDDIASRMTDEEVWDAANYFGSLK